MKKFRLWAIGILLAATIFLGGLTLIGILLVPAKIAPPESQVQEQISGIPYWEETPAASLLFIFPDSSGVFFYFDFSSLLTSCTIFDKNAEEKAAELPYFTDYKITAKQDFLPLLAERLGGIEMTDEKGEKRIYFSAALGELCEKGLKEEKRLELALSFFNKISKTGLSSEDFMFIIEETENSLSYSVCYDWIPHIKTMFSNIVLG